MKIIKFSEDSVVSKKGVTKTTWNETKEQKGRYLEMLESNSVTSSLGSILIGKDVVRV